jgi:hypothetical protein
MTIGNAMESIAKMPGADGILAGTTVSFFGPAYKAAKADSTTECAAGSKHNCRLHAAPEYGFDAAK